MYTPNFALDFNGMIKQLSSPIKEYQWKLNVQWNRYCNGKVLSTLTEKKFKTKNR